MILASGEGSKDNVDKAGDDRFKSTGGSPKVIPLSFAGGFVGDTGPGDLRLDML